MIDTSLTEAQLAATITSLLADVRTPSRRCQPSSIPPDSATGAGVREAYADQGQQRRLLQLQLAQAALAVAQAAVQEPAALPALAEQVAALQRRLADQPDAWLWKLEELGADLVALGLVNKEEAAVRALRALRDVTEEHVRVLEKMQDRSHGGDDV